MPSLSWPSDDILDVDSTNGAREVNALVSAKDKELWSRFFKIPSVAGEMKKPVGLTNPQPLVLISESDLGEPRGDGP